MILGTWNRKELVLNWKPKNNLRCSKIKLGKVAYRQRIEMRHQEFGDVTVFLHFIGSNQCSIRATDMWEVSVWKDVAVGVDTKSNDSLPLVHHFICKATNKKKPDANTMKLLSDGNVSFRRRSCKGNPKLQKKLSKKRFHNVSAVAR